MDHIKVGKCYMRAQERDAGNPSHSGKTIDQIKSELAQIELQYKEYERSKSLDVLCCFISKWQPDVSMLAQ